jgi:hypothetical protein
MTDDIITISAGAPASDITPGVYEVTLTDISEPRTIYPQTGANAGKEVQLRDWTFALEDGREVTDSASTSSGPKSKTYAWLTALLGGTPPTVGQSYPKSQLVGREALATIAIDEGGWAKIANLSARPRARAAGPVAVAAPVTAPAQPVVAQPVAADDLPF